MMLFHLRLYLWKKGSLCSPDEFHSFWIDFYEDGTGLVCVISARKFKGSGAHMGKVNGTTMFYCYSAM